jgi:hypothetical protein
MIGISRTLDSQPKLPNAEVCQMQKIGKQIRIVSLIGVLAIAMVFLALSPVNSVCAGQDDRGALPRVDGETQLFPGYPLQFDGLGHIDRIAEREIVVDDDLRALPSGADLHTPHSSHASRGRFAVGDYVGYQLDDKGAISSLWLLKKGKR